MVTISLKAWYPFNGNYNNQGVGDLELTQRIAPTYVDGKFGKAINTGQFKWTAEQTASVLNNQSITIAFWLYVNVEPTDDTAYNNIIFGNNSVLSDYNNRKFSIHMYPTINDLHLSWQNDEKNTTFLSVREIGFFPSYEWTHFCVTYDNPTVKIYRNGELYKTYGNRVSNSSSFEYETFAYVGYAQRYIQDFRVYDNALSPTEVKRLSQGLVLHMPLGNVDGKIGGRNLVEGTNQGILNWNWSMQTGDFTKDEVIDNGVRCCKLTKGDVPYTGWSVIAYTNICPEKYKLDCDYTISFDIYSNVSSSMYATFLRYNATGSLLIDNIYIYPKADTWVHVSALARTVFEYPDTNDLSQVLYFVPGNSEPGTYYMFKNLKIEEGNKATPWTPAPEDTPDFYDNTIYDTSGYLNNGTALDASCPTWSNDAPRYYGSYHFDGTQYITTDNPFAANTVVNELTITGWAKVTDGWNSTNGIYILSGGNYFISVSLGKEYKLWMICRYQDTDGAYTTFATRFGESSDIVTGQWYFIGVTFSNDTIKLYIDGKLVRTVVIEDCVGLHNYVPRMFIGTHSPSVQMGVGNVSDVRMYATALSDSDIQQIYKSSAIVEPDGTLLTYSVEEV